LCGAQDATRRMAGFAVVCFMFTQALSGRCRNARSSFTVEVADVFTNQRHHHRLVGLWMTRSFAVSLVLLVSGLQVSFLSAVFYVSNRSARTSGINEELGWCRQHHGHDLV